jgi:hypothetical protein
MGLGEKAFDRIIEAIRWAKSQGRIVDLSMVVVRRNLAEIPDFLRLADELGVHAVYLRSLIPGNYPLTFPDTEIFKAYPAWSHPEVTYLAGSGARDHRESEGAGLRRSRSMERATS